MEQFLLQVAAITLGVIFGRLVYEEALFPLFLGKAMSEEAVDSLTEGISSALNAALAEQRKTTAEKTAVQKNKPEPKETGKGEKK